MTDYRNWKTAVSTSDTDLQTLKHYRECGIQAVELSVSYDECADIPWEDFRRNADAAGIEVWSYHLPFGWDISIALPDEAGRQRAMAYLYGLMDKAAAIGIRRFIIHPSYEPIPEEERPLWMAAAKISLAEMAEYAAKSGSVVCVENLPRTCLGHTVGDMLELVSADDRLRVCFDVNHLLTEYGCTHRDFVEKLGHLIVTTHMSDYDFIDEKHLFPGYGMLDWKSVVEFLEAADYAGPFLYEGGFYPSGWAPEIPHGSIEIARERHMTIKQLRRKDHMG